MNAKKSAAFRGCVFLLYGLLGSVLLSANRVSAAVANVSVRNNVFSPGSVTINTNDQVTWTWAAADGATPHSTTSDTPGLWDSGIHTQPLTFTMSFPNAGSFPYHCTVHAGFGMVGTVKVQAVANVAPTITTQPASQTVSAGANVTFMVVATGTTPLTFQWRFNGANITGETGNSLLLRNVQTNNSGNYSVVVNNTAGFATSSDAVLVVQPSRTAAFVAGNYNGLFSDPNGVSQPSSGSFSFTVSTQGRFSGRLQNGGGRSSFSGQFDASGRAQRTIMRRGQSALNLVLQLDPDDPDQVTGTVTDGSFTADLVGDRAVFDGRLQVAPEAGRYTMILDGGNDSATTPGGNSYGTVTVDGAGRIRLAGSLADGTKLSQMAPISKAGRWPLYVPLYGGKGSLISWISFASTATSDLGGAAIWLKPALPTAKLYPGGFTLATSARGSSYQLGSGGAILSFSDGRITLSGADVAAEITDPITIGTGNRVVNLGTNKLVLTFVPATGLFKGRMMDPATARLVPFAGVVLQKENLGRGWFQGSRQTGTATLSGR